MPGSGAAAPGRPSEVEALQIENALLRELGAMGLTVPMEVLAAALTPLATLRDGKLLVEERTLSDAIPANLLASSGNSGSGSRAPKDLANLPPRRSVIESAVGSQAYYEANKEKVNAVERRDGLGSAKS